MADHQSRPRVNQAPSNLLGQSLRVLYAQQKKVEECFNECPQLIRKILQEELASLLPELPPFENVMKELLGVRIAWRELAESTNESRKVIEELKKAIGGLQLLIENDRRESEIVTKLPVCLNTPCRIGQPGSDARIVHDDGKDVGAGKKSLANATVAKRKLRRSGRLKLKRLHRTSL